MGQSQEFQIEQACAQIRPFEYVTAQVKLSLIIIS